MSIQRYTNEPFGAFAKCDGGEYVLYTDHLAELHNLLSTLADIRAALGVGEKPMLGELAGIVRTRMGVIKILEREAKAHAAEVERLTGERDAYRACLDGLEMRDMDKMATEGPLMAAAIGSEMARVIKAIKDERDALKSCLAFHDSHGPDGRNVTNSQFAEMRDERDAAVRERDAAVALRSMLSRHGCVEGCCSQARAALAKIEGGHNGR